MKKSKKNKKTIHKGGKLISKRPKSCIFRPNIPCDKKSIRSNKKISKLSFLQSDKENEINNIIIKIKNYKKYYAPIIKSCKTPDYKIIKKYDKDIKECLRYNKLEKNDLIESSLFTGDWMGGGTLEEYFNKKFKHVNNSNINSIFLDIMNKMMNIFLGLIILKKNNIIHLDIKPSNIMFDKNEFKIIDFGLSSKLDDIEHFKNRAYKESKQNRIYIWYPPSYLISQLSLEELEDVEKHIKNYNFKYFKSDADIYDSVRKYYKQSTHMTYNTNYYKLVKKGIIKFKTQKDIDDKFRCELNTIDTYSLGMIFPYLFVKNKLLKYINGNETLKSFFELFRLMINPEVSRRINIKEATILFNSLIVLNGGPNKLSLIKKILKQKKI